MKKALVVFFALFGLINIPLSAQANLEPRPFFLGLGASYPLGVVAIGGGYNQSGWGGTVSLNGIWSASKYAPADYQGWLLSNNLKDFTLFAAVRVLKEVPTNAKTLKYGIEAGPVLVHTSVADHFVKKSGWIILSNYTFERVKENSIGISLRGKLDWSLSDRACLELGFNTIIGKDKTYFGIDLIGTLSLF